MATFTKLPLSRMTINGTAPNGFINVNDSIPGSSDFPIHVSLNSATIYDEVWIWAVNRDSSATNFQLGFAMGTSTQTIVTVELPANSGLVLVSPGLLVSGEGTYGMEIYAACGNALCSVIGYVNRIS